VQYFDAEALQGMSSQIIKAVLSQALLFLSKDYFEHWAVLLLALWSKK
jgi:solute carrier family 25 (peroxisomal adenine nucleotide transporter), member 17